MTDQTSFTTVSDGDALEEGYFNGNYNVTKIIGSVYTGTDFDVTGSADDTANHTIAISAADIGDADVLLINLTYKAQATTAGAGANESNVTLQIERNETGQSSWSDVLAATSIVYSQADTGFWDYNNSTATLVLPITLTAGEKTNGIDIKITAVLDVTGTGTHAGFLTNISVFFTGLVS